MRQFYSFHQQEDRKQKGGDRQAVRLPHNCLRIVRCRNSPPQSGLLGCLSLLAFEDRAAADVHLNLLGLGFCTLAQLDFQNAITVVGATSSVLTVLGRVNERVKLP